MDRGYQSWTKCEYDVDNSRLTVKPRKMLITKNDVSLIRLITPFAHAKLARIHIWMLIYPAATGNDSWINQNSKSLCHKPKGLEESKGYFQSGFNISFMETSFSVSVGDTRLQNNWTQILPVEPLWTI